MHVNFIFWNLFGAWFVNYSHLNIQHEIWTRTGMDEVLNHVRMILDVYWWPKKLIIRSWLPWLQKLLLCVLCGCSKTCTCISELINESPVLYFKVSSWYIFTNIRVKRAKNGLPCHACMYKVFNCPGNALRQIVD